MIKKRGNARFLRTFSVCVRFTNACDQALLQTRRSQIRRQPNVSPPTCLQAWALFKGKFREGIDKPDPPTWKTRLRCALNKSNDFEELVERSQLDISDPYKVYRIIPEGAKKSQ